MVVCQRVPVQAVYPVSYFVLDGNALWCPERNAVDKKSLFALNF